jgi:hypothetical protein
VENRHGLCQFYEMEIRFVSSLTPEDEERLAQPVLDLVCSFLDRLPIVYTLRIATTLGTTVQRTREASACDSKS